MKQSSFEAQKVSKENGNSVFKHKQRPDAFILPDAHKHPQAMVAQMLQRSLRWVQSDKPGQKNRQKQVNSNQLKKDLMFLQEHDVANGHEISLGKRFETKAAAA